MPIRPCMLRLMPWTQGLLACASCVPLTILALASGIASGTTARDACPPPFIVGDLDHPDHHARCMLEGDATLGATLLIDHSQLTLDCRGHTLRPAQPGVRDDPATDAGETVYASPMVAFLFDDMQISDNDITATSSAAADAWPFGRPAGRTFSCRKGESNQ
jgi:hypothetical protein